MTCPELVSHPPAYVDFHPCGKPVKRNGYCGVHARMHERREAQRQLWLKDSEARRRKRSAGSDG